jgi:hypothetical protein
MGITFFIMNQKKRDVEKSNTNTEKDELKRDDLLDLKKPELVQKALNKGIEVPKNWSKEQIADAILEGVTDGTDDK